MISCKARRVADQMQCGACGLSWDVDDPDPPECSPTRRQPERTADPVNAPSRVCPAEQFKKIKEILND